MTWCVYDRWYVYELVDPRGGVTFYIGKTATPNGRFCAHKGDPSSAAYPRLREIARVGMEAEMRIIAEFRSEAEALDYEGYLISRTPGLLNRTGPYGTGNPPTKPFRRPVTGIDDLVYEATDEERAWSVGLERRVECLYQAFGGAHDRLVIKSILEKLSELAHEDAEFELPTDE